MENRWKRASGEYIDAKWSPTRYVVKERCGDIEIDGCRNYRWFMILENAIKYAMNFSEPGFCVTVGEVRDGKIYTVYGRTTLDM